MKQATLVFNKRRENSSGNEKEGIWSRKMEWTGGKFDAEKGDKNIFDAAIRETKEEIGVEIKNPEKVGLFHFKFEDKEEWDQDVTLFIATEWSGEPSESEEMRPKWFSFEKFHMEKCGRTTYIGCRIFCKAKN